MYALISSAVSSSFSSLAFLASGWDISMPSSLSSSVLPSFDGDARVFLALDASEATEAALFLFVFFCVVFLVVWGSYSLILNHLFRTATRSIILYMVYDRKCTPSGEILGIICVLICSSKLISGVPSRLAMTDPREVCTRVAI